MKSFQVQFVKSANMNADIVSSPLNIKWKFGASIQANSATSGSLGGTFTLEGSNDYQQDLNGNVINPGEWQTIANTAQTISGAGVSTWDDTPTSAGWIRLRYTHHSGDTGTLNAFATLKGNN